MGENNFILVSLEDPKMKGLSEVLGNKTCKKIIDYLAENVEASQKDLSDALSIPINTVEYNIKKLVSSGLVQKRKNFFWSKKGKKIVMYELSNKSIVISPKKSAQEKLKSILPAFMITLVTTFAIWVYEKSFIGKSFQGEQALAKTAELAMDSASGANSLYSYGAGEEIARVTTNHAVDAFSYSPSPVWMWFMAGALLVLFVVSIVNWRKL